MSQPFVAWVMFTSCLLTLHSVYMYTGTCTMQGQQTHVHGQGIHPVEHCYSGYTCTCMYYIYKQCLHFMTACMDYKYMYIISTSFTSALSHSLKLTLINSLLSTHSSSVPHLTTARPCEEWTLTLKQTNTNTHTCTMYMRIFYTYTCTYMYIRMFTSSSLGL